MTGTYLPIPDNNYLFTNQYHWSVSRKRKQSIRGGSLELKVLIPINNVCYQVIEQHTLAKLLNVFDLITVSAYTDDDLVRLAAESHQTRNRRNEALQLQEALERSL